jgi:hypothetical protein
VPEEKSAQLPLGHHKFCMERSEIEPDSVSAVKKYDIKSIDI